VRQPATSIAALFTLILSAGADQGLAATPDEISAARRASVKRILTATPASAIADQRLTCMLGEEPGSVTEARRAGQYFIPDAADLCVAVLVRTAHDGHLPDLYRKLLTELGGNVELAEKLPLAIGNALLDGDGKVDLGNGKNTIVPPPLAFDAGFTVAYLKGDDRVENMDAPKLKLVAESCLAVNKDSLTCFSAGYTYGQQAVRARNASAR
jgi:hypothetical protein